MNNATTGVPIVDAALSEYYRVFTRVYEPFWLSQKYPHSIPAVTITLYLLMVFYLPKLMKKFPATAKGINLGFILPLWNLFLSAGSLAMAVGMGIPYFKFLFENGFFNGICDEEKNLFVPNTMPYWAHIFVASKYFELIDTLFLILKHPNKDVPLLHWYHHTTVLLFTWYADLYLYTGGVFMVVNAVIHTFMYWYYFRSEMGHRPWWSKPLTMGQISQMFIGIFVNGSWMFMRYGQKKECPCRAPYVITAACLIMYASYAYLFIKFFLERYAGKPKVAAEKKTEEKKTEEKKQQ